MLLTDSGDELCGPYYLLYFRQWLITRPLSAFLPLQPLFTESLHGDQLLALLPASPVPLQHTAPSAVCVLVFSSLFIQFFFCFVLFLWGRGACLSQG
jgi:hypothetical protein